MAQLVNKNTRSRKKLFTYIVIIVLLLAGLAATGLFIKKYRDLSSRNRELNEQIGQLNQEIGLYKNDPEQAAQAEVDRYVSEIGKLYALPSDEKPSVATVKDKEQLKDQQFFARAENGDITLIYAKAKLAILYRPSTEQLVNVSSVTIQDNPESSTEP